MNNSIFGVVSTHSTKPKLKAMFIENDFTNAKLWFQGYITGENQPINWVLYKLGEIDNNLKITGNKIYICTGTAVLGKPDKKYEQLKIWEKKKRMQEEARILKTINTETETTEIIQKLFGGKIIREGGENDN